jgi:DNA polymerase III, gamma/tau subunits
MNYDLIYSQKDTWSRLVKKSESGNIANAYLFSGPIGSGKEGLALIFAHLLNCNSSKTEKCFQCDSCIKFKSLQHEKI